MGKASTDDRLLIRELYDRYHWAMNRGDTEGVRACFDPDAITTRYDGSTVTLDGVVETATKGRGDPVAATRQHHLLIVDPDGTGSDDLRPVHIYFILTEVREPPAIAIHSSCYTHDVVRRTDDGWRFSARSIHHTWPKPPL